MVDKNSKFLSIKDFKFTIPIQIRFSDLDIYNHVNHAVFLSYSEYARVSYTQELIKNNPNYKVSWIIANVNIDYFKQLLLTDQLILGVRTLKIGSKSATLLVGFWIKKDNNFENIAISSVTAVCFDFKSQTSILIPENVKEVIYNFEIIKPL